MSNALDAVPAAARAVIVDELIHRDPALLATFAARRSRPPNSGMPVERLLATAVINSVGADWTPNEYGLAVERAVKTFLEVWPSVGNRRWDSKRVEERPNYWEPKAMTGPGSTAQEILRDDILAGGHDDWVSMAEVRGCISRGRLADSVPERQRLVVDTVRSLLLDRLVEIGDIPGRGDPGFKPWPGSVDDVMTAFTDRFVRHHDDRLGWEYTIWLNLTAKGEKASAEIVRKRKSE